MRKRREIWGIVAFCLLTFTIVSLLSFHPRDPSFNSVSSNPEVLNWGGLAGSYFSDILFQTFGISAFLLLLPLIFFTIQAFFPSHIPSKWGRALGLLFLILFTSTLWSLSLKTLVIRDQELLAGGIVGHLFSSFLLPYFNQVGSYIVVLGGVLINLVLALNISITGFIQGGAGLFSKLFSFLPKFSLNASSFKLNRTSGPHFKSTPRLPISEREEPIILEDDEIEDVEEVAIEENSIESLESVEEIEPPIEFEEEKPSPQLHPPSPPTIVTPSLEAPKKKILSRLPLSFSKPKGHFKLPKLDLLSDEASSQPPIDRELLLKNSQILEQKLKNFNIEGRVVEVRPGPVITVYEFEPAPGVKVSKIVNLSDDLALALSAVSVRIVAPIPGKSVVGIELPNEQRTIVYLKEILENNEFRSLKYRLPLPLGKSISGEAVISDLARMPHLLVAGATGSGKSVFLNTVICSFLFRYTPDQLRFLMIDPKMLELSMYDHIPHLLLPVVTDPKKAALALKWAVQEMDRRYTLMAKLFVRNIDSYNKKIEDSSHDELNLLLKEDAQEGSTGQEEFVRLEKLPYIIIIIDELADLMMVASKDVELSIARLAQMARAAGIHLLVATQRPSVDVVTGLIKANFPARISFQVSSKIDSRTILDCIGAEKLLGNGDMLYSPPGVTRVKRVHGAFVSDQEVRGLVQFLKAQGAPHYEASILSKKIEEEESTEDFEEDDGLYQEAIALVAKYRYASISMIQRRLRIGYNRAARMIEQMESEGLVGPQEGAKPREVLMKPPEQS